MTLTDFASLGNAVGGVGILLTVIYMSIELRGNTLAVRSATFQRVVDSFASISFDIAKEESLTRLFLRAGQGFAALDDVDRTRYSFMLLSFLRRAENVYFQSKIRTLHDLQWAGIRSSITWVMSSPGAHSCWSEIRDRFNPQFSAFIDGLKIETPHPSLPKVAEAKVDGAKAAESNIRPNE